VSRDTLQSQHSLDLELAPVLRMIASPDTRTRRMRAVAAACIAHRPLFVLSLYVRACALRYVASLTLWRCVHLQGRHCCMATMVPGAAQSTRGVAAAAMMMTALVRVMACSC
jgi:hypothetical protein